MNLDNRGFLYAEVLIMIAIMGTLFTVGAIAGRNFLANTIAEFEAAKLIASIRNVQELNRNSYIVREGEFKKIEPKNSTLFRVVVYDNSYYIKSSFNKFPDKYYKAVKNVTFKETSSFGEGIIFDVDGNPKRLGSVEIKAKFTEKNANRYVIIDKAGRIRMDRIMR